MRNLTAWIFTGLAVFFALVAMLAYHKSWKLQDLRTLKLGRLVLRSFIAIFFALNFALLAWIFFLPDQNGLIIIALLIEAAALLFAPSFITIFIIISIIVLTVKMWRRESKSVANLLLPIVLIISFILTTIYLYINGLPSVHWNWLQMLAAIYPILSLYLTWQFLVFYVSSRAYGRRAKSFTAKYYVVHGAGLIGGEKVGHLLGNRIKTAVNAAKDDTMVVLSGGKGDDEHLSEAAAMKKYAVEELGFPAERILLEDQSRTTYENLVNSANLIKEKFLIFTSDYHVFRTVLFAAQLKLDAQGGPGGKTAFYYRAPAFLREFIAVLNFQRKKHIIVVAGIVAFFALLSILVLLITP